MPNVPSSPIAPKLEQEPLRDPSRELSHDPSLSSVDSSADVDVADGDGEGDGDPSSALPANPPTQKRKGGRKPIYATSEERKQRNRQAQAAFRERRTEYIKQLETTIKHQDDTLQNLQQSHRAAADECLMLRYKNSLLERILLEKGIDVQAELKIKEAPLDAAMPPIVPPQMPLQRPVIGRQHPLHRSVSGTSTTGYLQQPAVSAVRGSSPQMQATPSSQESSSSATRSPSYGVPVGLQGATAALSASMQGQAQPPVYSAAMQQQQQHRASLKGAQNAAYPQALAVPLVQQSGNAALSPHVGHGRNASNSSSGPRPTHWPSPYQTHIEQLEQEYDTHSGIMEETESGEDGVAGTERFSSGVGQPPISHHPAAQMSQQAAMLAIQQSQQQQQQQRSRQEQLHAGIPPGSGAPTTDVMMQGSQGFDPFDPMLDADPFGLTASMHFPAPQFPYHDSQPRK